MVQSLFNETVDYINQAEQNEEMPPVHRYSMRFPLT